MIIAKLDFVTKIYFLEATEKLLREISFQFIGIKHLCYFKFNKIIIFFIYYKIPCLKCEPNGWIY